VSRREERELAARLARVLDGQEPAGDEVAALVTVLERATEPARFEVADEVVERELARARPRLHPSRGTDRRPGPRLALAFGAVAAAAVALLVFTLVRVPGIDIEGKALAALGGSRSIFRIDERIEPVVPGTFPSSLRAVWLDPSLGLERWYQLSHGTRVEEVLVEPGRISRLLPGQNLLIVAPSCRAFASGCAETVDPVAFYRRALEARGTVRAKREGSFYHLTLPVQTLADEVRIEQRVTIDAHTYLPTEIEWLEQRRGGRMHAVSRIVIESVKRLPRDQVFSPFHLPVLPEIHVQQRTESSVPLRKLGERRLTLSEARLLRPPLLWLGESHQGQRVEVDEVRFNAGKAYRVRYGPVTVWNYRSVIPPELVSARFAAPSKTIPLGNRIARFYESANGLSVAEFDARDRSAAIVAPSAFKEDVIAKVRALRPLR
jgi:hypothetical protein